MIQDIAVFNHILVDINSHEPPYSDGGNVHICPAGCSHAYSQFLLQRVVDMSDWRCHGRTAYLNYHTFMFVRGHVGFCT